MGRRGGLRGGLRVSAVGAAHRGWQNPVLPRFRLLLGLGPIPQSLDPCPLRPLGHRAADV